MGTDDILRRVPPQAIEAEQSVLGAILLDQGALDFALEIISGEDFYREAHKTIFACMFELAERQIPIDAITLTEWLKTKNALEQIGGPAYIADLAAVVPTAANVSHYARIVHDKAVLRSLGSIATDIASASYEAPADVEGFLDDAERRIFDISQKRIVKTLHGMPELSRETIRQLERLYERQELITGVPTGYKDLDVITCGLQPSDVVVIAARPSMGKTALALNIAAHAGMRAQPKRVVAFFSLEMSKEQLMIRLICSEARIEGSRARSGYLAERDFPKLAQAAADLSESEIFIDDSSDNTILQIKAKCRRLARQRGSLGLVIVDYLQLVRAGRRGESREKDIAEISRSLKGLAKELNVPVVALAQLNRQVESRENKRPILADLRESGAIEQDADVIAFIYRDEMYHKESKEKGMAEVLIAKQRNGPIGLVKLAFLQVFSRFENYVAESLFPEGENG